MNKPILCLDFDGVLHSYTSGWQGADVVADPPVPGAINFLYRTIGKFKVAVYSSRSGQPGGIDAMRNAIVRWEKEWRAQQTLLPKTSLVLNLEFPTEKPPAMVTIDDRAITFTGQWPSVESLLAFQPWNKKPAA